MTPSPPMRPTSVLCGPSMCPDMKNFVDLPPAIAAAVWQQYSGLKRTGKPQPHEYSALAAFVVTHRGNAGRHSPFGI